MTVNDSSSPGASGRNWAAYGAEVRLADSVQAVDKALLSDPQTSGGLLVACAPEAVDQVLSRFIHPLIGLIALFLVTLL